MSLHDLFNYLWNMKLDDIFNDLMPYFRQAFGLFCLVVSISAVIILIQVFREEMQFRAEKKKDQKKKYPY